MQLWDYTRAESTGGNSEEELKKSGTCCSIDDIYDARRVARFLNLPFYVVNFEKAFEQEVVVPFVESYLSGETPIPCVRCNTFMKFDHLLNRATQIGADKLATGHYARVRFNETTGRYELLRGVDAGKDQSYFLFEMTQSQLSRVIFPLGGYPKSEVRAMAESMGCRFLRNPTARRFASSLARTTAHLLRDYIDSRELTNFSGG